jgi:hypothetical protein
MKHPLPIWRRHALLYMGINWRLIRELLLIVLLLLSGLLLYERWVAADLAYQQLEKVKVKLDHSEYYLLKCMNGGYSGVYRFDKDDKVIGFQCNAKAWEV